MCGLRKCETVDDQTSLVEVSREGKKQEKRVSMP